MAINKTKVHALPQFTAKLGPLMLMRSPTEPLRNRMTRRGRQEAFLVLSASEQGPKGWVEF